MNLALIIESLEYYYENEVFEDYDRGKMGIESTFETLAQCIKLQQEIISCKTLANIDMTKNEETLENLKRYWKEDVNNPQEVLDTLKEEIEHHLKWLPLEIKNYTEKGWNDVIPECEERLQQAKDKYKVITEYTIHDLEKITGPCPF